MSESKQVKKPPISEIGKTQRKITIADEIELETQYRIEPPLTALQLTQCWLEASEQTGAYEKMFHMIVNKHTCHVPKETMETLKEWLQPEVLSSGKVKFVCKERFRWSRIRNAVIRKFNLSGLYINAMKPKINQIKIKSRQPLYDQDAHANRVRNLLRAVKILYPWVHFEHEGCLTSGACPVGLQDALRKLAEETHGKRLNLD